MKSRQHAGFAAPVRNLRLATASALALLCSTAVRAQVVEVNLTATPGTAQVAPGTSVNAWLYNGSLPGPTLRITEGQTLRVRFRNELPEATAVHWHGQPVPLGMDGVPSISRPAVAPGQEFIYELNDLVPGTYWYHPHGNETQLSKGPAGMLIVDPANAASDPTFDVEHTIILDDWSNPLGGAFSGHLLNGRSSLGQVPFDVQPGQKLRIRVVNVASTTNYVFALDGHPMTVTHADGNRVQPVVTQAIPIGIGERWDVIVDCNNPGTWSFAVSDIANRTSTLVRGVIRYTGQGAPIPAANYVPANLSGGSLLSYSQLASFHPVQPITSTPDRSYTASLGMGMGPGGMAHLINGQAWPNVTPFLTSTGENVQLTISNGGMMMMPFYHPMHIHGHFFRLMGTAGGTTAPPIKDTILIRPAGQPGSSFTSQITMDNPGRWLFHCHNADHMGAGMMTIFDYLGDDDGDGIETRSDMEPTADIPVVTISSFASAFTPGASDVIRVQWTQGQVVALFAGPAELQQWSQIPNLGLLVLDPATASPLGAALTSPSGEATFPYALPNNPAIVGTRVGIQGVGIDAPSGDLVLTTFQALTAN